MRKKVSRIALFAVLLLLAGAALLYRHQQKPRVLILADPVQAVLWEGQQAWPATALGRFRLSYRPELRVMETWRFNSAIAEDLQRAAEAAEAEYLLLSPLLSVAAADMDWPAEFPPDLRRILLWEPPPEATYPDAAGLTVLQRDDTAALGRAGAKAAALLRAQEDGPKRALLILADDGGRREGSFADAFHETGEPARLEVILWPDLNDTERIEVLASAGERYPVIAVFAGRYNAGIVEQLRGSGSALFAGGIPRMDGAPPELLYTAGLPLSEALAEALVRLRKGEAPLSLALSSRFESVQYRQNGLGRLRKIFDKHMR